MRKILNNVSVEGAIRAFPTYVIIFCIQTPLSFHDIYGSYYDRYSLGPAIVTWLAISLILFTVFRRLLPDIHLAGLATLTGLMLLFPNATMTVPVYPAVAIAGFGILVARLCKRNGMALRDAIRIPEKFTYIVNVVAATMMFAILGRMAYHDYKVEAEADAVAAKALAPISRSVSASKPSAALPHIIHIVLDGYSRADVLQSTYGFDNAPFLDALRQRGFHIADKATTPYNQTLLVMSAIFSLGAVSEPGVIEIPEDDHVSLRRQLSHSLKGGVVATTLRDLGYELKSTPSTYLPLQWNDVIQTDGHAPALRHFGLRETYIFGYDLLMNSQVLSPLIGPLLSKYFDIAAIDYRNLIDVPKRRVSDSSGRPQFVYQHILAPHPPFIITPDGRPRSLGNFPVGLADGSHLIQRNNHDHANYRDGYIDKLQYINGAILEQIDGLKRTLPGPLIIILHGDHGGGLHFDQNDRAHTCVNERFSPLLAVYATDPAIARQFDGDFNLVNIYRAIFRVLLKIDLPNMPNRSTFISWDLQKSAALDPVAMEVPCAAPPRTWTADRKPGAADSPSKDVISR